MFHLSFAHFWLIAGFIFLLLEFLIPGGIVSFLGVSAIIVAALVHLELVHGILEAITLWFIVSLVTLFGFRGVVQKFLPSQVSRSNTDEDLDAFNQSAIVCETIPKNGTGRIEFRDSTWSARNFHSEDSLPEGSKVRIVYRDGITWIVEAEDYLNKDHP